MFDFEKLVCKILDFRKGFIHKVYTYVQNYCLVRDQIETLPDLTGHFKPCNGSGDCGHPPVLAYI